MERRFLHVNFATSKTVIIKYTSAGVHVKVLDLYPSYFPLLVTVLRLSLQVLERSSAANATSLHRMEKNAAAQNEKNLHRNQLSSHILQLKKTLKN